MLRSKPALLTLATLATLTACAEGDGSVEFRIWGEDFIEVGIPAAELADGWAIEFSRFEVETADISLAGVELDAEGPFEISEASDGEGQMVGLITIPSGDHDDATFTITRVMIEGTARKDGVEKSFAWTFDEPTHYEDCEVVTSVRAGEIAVFQITVHADHLFYDSLVSEEPALRFEAIAAADGDDDGQITMVELAAADIGAYDPGNLPIDDLWAFLAAQARTMGHANGEAHCHTHDA